jgi:methylated-DNA-[protein]-cysteine S-methyltransferase
MKTHHNPKLQVKINSPIGALYLIASPDGLEAVLTEKSKNVPQLQFVRSNPKNKPNILKNNSRDQKSVQLTRQHLQQAEKQLQEYFSGRRKKFDLKLNASGTDFQKRVWQELSCIPYGQMCSYKDIASRIQKPNATRAVGNANGKNPLCIIVPCHRVIAANNKIGGYSGGLPLKKYLLTLEAKRDLHFD